MRQRPLRIEGRTYFQQKYAAKQETRRYHGEHLTKRQWQNIFRHSLHSVVPMNARVLAGSDGSEQAMGRGSGLDLLSPGRGGGGGVGGGRVGDVGLGAGQQVLKVPYMNQMWAPMERRLDMAVFRAMFASSARQARQFVVHGFVCVNGKRMKHPGYMLNPGDMFSVEPEQVLFATGRSRDYLEVKSKIKGHVARRESGGEGEGEAAEKEEGKGEEAEAKKSDKSESDSESDSDSDSESPSTTTSSTTLDATTIPGATITTTPTTPTNPQSPTSTPSTSTTTTTTPTTTTTTSTTLDTKPKPEKTDPHNPLDASKLYLTPWQPRDYLSPFAFIPRYLEVNFTICHAVYLRHPVARPGATEVPSPFGPEMQQLAFHWFLRRR